VFGDEVVVPWAELGARLEEVAVVRLLDMLAADDPVSAAEALWKWQHPLTIKDAP
jgi:hypothetical protein